MTRPRVLHAGNSMTTKLHGQTYPKASEPSQPKGMTVASIGGQGQSGWGSGICSSRTPCQNRFASQTPSKATEIRLFRRKTIVNWVKPVQFSTIFSEFYPKIHKNSHTWSVWKYFPYLPTVGPPILPIFRLLGPRILLPPGPPVWFSSDLRRLGGFPDPPPAPSAKLW